MMNHAKIGKGNIEDILGLTAMQEGMLYHYLSNPDSKQYFEQIHLHLSGEIEIQSFKAAWQAIARNNEMLRAVIRWEKLDEPVQIILKEKEIPIRVFDLSRENDEEQKRSLAKLISDDKDEKIDLRQESLRVTLCILGKQQIEMLITFHHILFDGWSNGVVLSEFLQAYEALLRHEKPPLLQKTKYKEFFKWYRSQDRTQQDRFWEAELSGFDTRTLLPYDKSKPAEIRTVAAHKVELPQAVREPLDTCLQEHNITLALLLFAAWGILLQKYNNSNDVIFGVTTSGRTPAVKGVEDIVGLFINTLPVRFNASGELTLLQVFELLGDRLKERGDFEHTSLTNIKKFVGFGKENNLFDSIVVIDNYPLDNIKPGGPINVNSYRLFEMTNFDLTIQVLPYTPDRPMEVYFHYNAEAFEPATIARLANHYVNILAGAAQSPTQEISEILMLSEAETKQILSEFNSPTINFLVDKTIQGVIEEQAQKTPQHIAVIGPEVSPFGDRSKNLPGESSQTVTCSRLNESANRLAAVLKEKGVQPGSRVVMMFPRSIEMIIAVLGILKSGAACIPLDISYPEERNSFIITDSEAGFLLTAKEISIDLEESRPITTVIFDADKLETYPLENPGSAVKPEDLSYIIYTSGSTGNPKGALLHHSGIVNHTHTKIQVLGIDETDTVANNFSINVIASIWQILAPLFCGARLQLYSEEIEWDPYAQFARVEQDGVTVIEVIPPVLKAYLFLLEEGKEKIKLERLRKIALTSEETKPSLVNKFYAKYNHIDLVDCYGQTECCDDVLHYTIPRSTDTQKVPIGTPALNTRVSILNHHRQLQPIGVPGEICVSGAGVMYGYWNRPELNEEKLIMPPATGDHFEKGFPGPSQNFCIDKNFSGGQGGRFFKKAPLIYKTGDLGRWLPDGKVEYLGRLDHQVKIRGNRVELREIENHVLRYRGVKEAVVVPRVDKEDEQSLYAFIVSGEPVVVSEIRSFLLQTLPDYMVPAHFIALEKFPLTPNGKIDRKELVRMEIKEGLTTGTEYTPPTNEFETAIRKIWIKLLLDGANEQAEGRIGINDNFFDLGGHSLLLIKLKSQLEKAFQLKNEISIIELFNYPTIAHQARFIEENLEDKNKSANEKLLRGVKGGSFHEKRPPGYDHDIAVIGVSLRVPGARDITQFWENLVNGVEAIEFFSEDELEGSQVEDYVKGRSMIIPAGGILGEVDLFDADFFGFNPREAEIIEPQQRLFLEHAWMALEDAGYGDVGDSHVGDIGVYAGVGLNTYLLNNVMANPKVVASLGEFQTMIGNDKDFLSTRVAYKLNLKGPAVTLQSACSTSLVAVHLARQGLLNHDCDMAVVGGVAVHIPEKTGYFYNEGGYLSPDGHCRAFAHDAQGTVFGNGIGVVVLKRSADAVHDNDHIYAVIKGSAINNDGSLKVGYTSPSEIGQAKAILRALQDARVTPDTIGYIETHGTGTVLGDPVEMAALTRAYREFPGSDHTEKKKQYCAVASVKSSIGHLDIAAGVVGFIKAVLCLKHKQIPPSINVEKTNPMIDFADTPFYVNTQFRDWVSNNGAPRRAGVSSFGIGGTNAHVILEEWTDSRRPVKPASLEIPGDEGSLTTSAGNYHLLLLSSRSRTALQQMTGNLVDYLKNQHINPGGAPAEVRERRTSHGLIADVSYTLKTGRKAFDHRLALVCRDRQDAIATLTAFDPKTILMYTRTPGDKSIVFMFPGVGEHYVDMGYELYLREPIFRSSVDNCCAVLEPLLGRDLREVLFSSGAAGKEEKNRRSSEVNPAKIDLRKMLNREEKPLSKAEEELSRTIYCQTAVFVMEYALARLLMEWGVKPFAMIGYSIGEYTAACLAGIFSLQDALSLVAGRARLIHNIEQGAMTAVSLAEKEIAPLLTRDIAVAAVNTPDLCIVSGKTSAVAALEKQLQEKKAVFRRLKTFQAFHSPMMEKVRDELTALCRQVTFHTPRIPYISNLTGTWAAHAQAASPKYWVDHTVSPIRFAQGIGELLKTSCNFFLEVGPGNSLCGFTAQHPEAKNKQKAVERFVLASMPGQNENQSSEAFLLRTLGKLWTAGLEIDWTSYYRHEGRFRKRMSLPTYPFERKRYWLEPETRQPEVAEPSRIKSAGAQILKKENIADWFYIPAWKQSAPPPAPTVQPAESGNWLFFIDEDSQAVAFDLVEKLRLRNDPRTVTFVKPGLRFEKSIEQGCDVYQVQPGRYEDYLALLADLQQQGKSVDKIIHLWQWDAHQDVPESVSPDFLERGVYSLLYLVKALGKMSMFDRIEIWLATRGLHQIESSDRNNPQKAAVLGPCKVIPQEYPNIICRCIDFNGETTDNNDNEQIVTQLAAELVSPPHDRIIAYRGFNRWVQTFDPVKLGESSAAPPILREKGVYLISGGLGKIGLAIAQYLAREVKARLVLISRSKFPAQEKEHSRVKAVEELRELGAEVLLLQADVADLSQMRDAVKQAEERFSVIHGVLHAAGVMSENAFKLIAESDRADCELHFKPKIYGLQVLHQVFREKELDFCLLTSSLSPILGGLSLFAYSAANSFMDGFAQQQALVQGKNWLSINWADWQREAAANDACANLVLGSTVFQLNISPEEGRETFKRILALNRGKIPGVVISSGDLQQRLQQWVLPSAAAGTGEETGSADRPVQQIHQRPHLQSIYEAPKNEPEKIVVEIWQDLLGIDMIGVYDNFFELGGHSLIATKLISRLREIFRIDIPLPVLFDRPTVREVVDNIANEWGDVAVVEEIARTYRQVYSP